MVIEGYKTHSSLQIGNIDRYLVKYKLYDDDDIKTMNSLMNSSSLLKLKIKNKVNLSYRAAGLMTGPYSLYCEIKPMTYHHGKHLFATSDQPRFEPNLQPQQVFETKLELNDFSNQEILWCVDVVSQILLTSVATINYNISITFEDGVGLSPDRLFVTKLNTLDLWELPLKKLRNTEDTKKDHLVILTHGLLSNLTADMFYIKEEIENSDPHCLVTGYSGNVGQTERGIKYLGIKLAEHIVGIIEAYPFFKKISFVAHSLGGLVQTFAIAYIGMKYPLIFAKLDLENFITLASPLIGVLADNPKYVQLFLTAGMMGKSGMDLGLYPLEKYKNECLLSLLPCDHTLRLLRKFKRRTIYANAINDGVVPLYTSCLLYVDYDAILESLDKKTDVNMSVEELEGESTDFFQNSVFKPLSKAFSLLAPQVTSKPETREIPKLSMLDTASHVLLQPIAPTEYIMNPSTRSDIILHDKIYTPADIQKLQKHTSNIDSTGDKKNKMKIELILDIISGSSDAAKRKEEIIATRWHRDISWRKVIVGLEPDAHNNINVRRRFANAYGWQVIDHLTSQHFVEKTMYSMPDDGNNTSSAENEVLDEFDYDWLLEPEKPSLLDVGATGLISTMSDFVDNFSGRIAIIDDEASRNNIGFDDSQSSLFEYKENKDMDIFGS